MTVTVTSPDANLAATIDRQYRLTLQFRRGAYGYYDESNLAHQLGQLGRLAWPAYLREQQAALARADRVIDDGDPKRRAYREALQQIQAAAVSPHGWLEITSTGLAHWTCHIQPGALAQLWEEQFVAEVAGAVAELVRAYRQQTVLLKDQHFGFDLPPDLRRLIEPRR